MSKHTVGSKYEEVKDESRVQIAARIRADIKAAVVSGTLPAGTYSVRTRSYSGGGSIDIAVVAVTKPGFVVTNPNPEERYSEELKAVVETLNGFHDAYNYNNSDSQSDYFDVNYYGHVQVHSTWLEAAQAAEKSV